MLAFLLRRLLGAMLVLGLVSLLTFALLDLAPGDAAQATLGDTASAEQLAGLRHQLGLDQPLLVRYLSYLAGAARGDLGASLMSGRPVAELVAGRFLKTLELALAAICLAVPLGGLVGMLSAARPGGYLDLALMASAALGLSVPPFWLALLLIMLFSLRLGWLPVLGTSGPASLVLPAICLAMPMIATVARLLRSSLLDVRDAEYVLTARGKGLTQARLWRDHILRNSLVPLVTMLGLYLGHLMGGTFIIETVFAYPGLGSLLVQSVLARDLPTIMAGAGLAAIVYLSLNLAVDGLQVWLDPRLRQKAA